MYIPDPIEQMEMRAEAMEHLFRDGVWHCCECEQPIPPGHEHTLSADPAAPPVCWACFKEVLDG